MDRRIAEANLKRLGRLVKGVEDAVQEVSRLFPLDPNTFSPEEIVPRDTLLLDGFRARFSDLQYMLGRTMFKTVAQLDEDERPGAELTTRERTVLMEKRGLLSVEQWQEIREVRNRFAHEYPDQHAEKAVNLNAAWTDVPVLISVAQGVERYLVAKHGLTN